MLYQFSHLLSHLQTHSHTHTLTHSLTRIIASSVASLSSTCSAQGQIAVRQPWTATLTNRLRSLRYPTSSCAVPGQQHCSRDTRAGTVHKRSDSRPGHGEAKRSDSVVLSIGVAIAVGVVIHFDVDARMRRALCAGVLLLVEGVMGVMFDGGS